MLLPRHEEKLSKGVGMNMNLIPIDILNSGLDLDLLQHLYEEVLCYHEDDEELSLRTAVSNFRYITGIGLPVVTEVEGMFVHYTYSFSKIIEDMCLLPSSAPNGEGVFVFRADGTHEDGCVINPEAYSNAIVFEIESFEGFMYNRYDEVFIKTVKPVKIKNVSLITVEEARILVGF